MLKPNGETVLRALEQAELITITSSRGRPQAIRPGKPVYQAAFKQLTADIVLAARMDLAILNQLVKLENVNIDKYEAELTLLNALPKQPQEIIGRVRYLLAKLRTSQEKVETWEKESGGLKKVLVAE